jgi:hypothetical protein
MSSSFYTVEKRNMFVFNNITLEQTSLLTTLNVSVDNNIKVNLLDISQYLLPSGLYNLYLCVGITNEPETTFIMEEQFKKNIQSMNLSYKIKKVIVIGNLGAVTNIPGVWRRFITQCFENKITVELFVNSVGTKNNSQEQTFLILPEDPFQVDLLFSIIENTNYANFDSFSLINVNNVLCLVENQYKK